jgi:hypothetical protein
MRYGTDGMHQPTNWVKKLNFLPATIFSNGTMSRIKRIIMLLLAVQLGKSSSNWQLQILLLFAFIKYYYWIHFFSKNLELIKMKFIGQN